MAYLLLTVQLQDDIWKTLSKEQQDEWVDTIVSECNNEGYVSRAIIEHED